MRRHVGFKRFLCFACFVRRHLGFKRFYGLRAHLLFTDMWVLRDWCSILCTGMWVLSDFGTLLDGRGACFVHKHVGFKRFRVEEAQLLCTSMWVLSEFMD